MHRGLQDLGLQERPEGDPTPSVTARSPYAITYARMPPREWNAASYDRVSDPQLAMARDVIDRLDLRGDERVLDAGCGTGRVTEQLLERVPNGSVVAVDGSEAMVEQARERLGDRVEAFASDLLDLTLDEPGRRDPLHRHLPLDRRPRAAVRAPARRAAARRPARRAVRRLRQRRQRAGGDRRRRPSGAARLGRAVELRDAAATRGATRGRRLHRRLDLAAAVAGRARGPARVLLDDDPRLAPRPAAGRRADAVRDGVLGRGSTSPSSPTTSG